MENFGHSVVSIGGDEVQQATNSILFVTDGSVNLDGELKQVAVLSDAGVGQLVTISHLDDAFENVLVFPNSPDTSAVKVEYVEEEEEQEEQDSKVEEEHESNASTGFNQETVQEPPNKRRRTASTAPKPMPVCKICCKTFSKRKGYTKHMRKIHKVFVRTKKGEKATEQDLICQYCNKTFSQKGSLNVHVLAIHNPEGLEHTYKCTECDYKTFIKSKYQTHVVRNHLVKKPERKKKVPVIQEFRCDMCDKVFKSRSNLNAHSNRVHFPQHDYKCNQCTYTTTDKYFFKKHLVRRHLSNKPKGNFTCDKCDATFQKLIYMKVHQKRIHKIKLPNSTHRKKCPLCPFVSRQLYRDEILAHFRDIHSIEFRTEKLVVDDVDSFNKWRTHVQETTNSQYKGDSLTEPRTKWFNCHRSGHYDLSKGAHRSNGLYTTIKINAFCPAAIHTTRLDGGQMEVEYWPVHVGHDPNEPNKKKTFLSNTDIEVKKIEKTLEKRRSKRLVGKRKPAKDSDDDIDIEMTPVVHRSSKLDYDKLVQSAVQTRRKLRKIEDGVEVITIDNMDDEYVETPEDKSLTIDYDKLVKDSLDMELAVSSVDDGTILRGKEVDEGRDSPKSFKCGYCSFVNTVREDCQKHVREEHANHKCTECDFRTTDYTNLRVHMRKHSKQLSYKCERCDKKFLYQRQLSLHLEAIHDAKKKANGYECDYCDYSSSQMPRLKSHMKKFHDAEKVDARDRKFKCKLCEASYTSKGHLHRHENLAHELEQDREWWRCSDCSMRFRHRSSLIHHEKHAHQSTPAKQVKQCPLCEFESLQFARSEMHEHLRGAHSIALSSQVYLFNDLTSFTEWKADLEAATGSTLNGRQGTKTRFYMCLKSRQTLPEKGEDGVVKERSVVAFCPSEIHLRKFGDGQLLAEYWPLHIGHETQHSVNRALSVSWVNAFTATQRGINMKYCLKANENCLLSNNNKSSDKETPNVVEEDFNLVWIDKLRANTETCMLHVKPTNTVSEDYPFFKDNDFFLIYMTCAQKDKFDKLFSMNGTIIVDKTRNIGVNLNVFTILVVDESRTACPVACMFTNESDADNESDAERVFLRIFFEKLKIIFGCLTPEMFMSSIGDIAYSVWCDIMSAAKTHVYSTMHVLRAWRSNLDKIANKENREHVSSVLKSLLCEVDKAVFIELLDEIKKSLMFENEVFFKYFSDNYLTDMRYKLWANCYAGERSVSFDSYERVLKQCHLIGVSSSNVNKVLRLNLETFADESRDWSSKSVQEKLSIIKDRHTSSLVQSCGGVTKADDCKWLVRSLLKSESEFYIVKKIASCRSCELVCGTCETCAHEYVCSCWDSAVRDNMCVHVHLVARSLLQTGDGCQGYETVGELAEDLMGEEEDEDESIELNLVVDETGEEEEGGKEEDDDQEGEEIVIHCGSLLNSKSAEESDGVDEEVDDPDWVFDSDSEDENQLKKVGNKTINESKVSKSDASDDVLKDTNKNKSFMPKIKLNSKRKRSDVSGGEVMEESLKTPAARSRKQKVISDDNIEEASSMLRSDVTLEIYEERSPISKAVKTVGKSDKEGDSVRKLSKNEPQLQLKIVDIRSISKYNSFVTKDETKNIEAIPDESQKKPRIQVIPTSKLQSPLKAVDTESVKSTRSSVSRNEYDKMVEDVISVEPQEKPRIRVIPTSKLQSPLEVVDTKSVKSTRSTVSRNEYDKMVEEVISVESKEKPRISVVSPSKLQTHLEDVDPKNVKNKQGRSKTRTKDEEDNEVIPDESPKYPRNNIVTRSKLQTPLKVVDSKIMKDKQGRVSRSKDKKRDNKVIPDKLQKKPVISVITRSKIKTPLKVSESKSIKKTQGSASKTKDKKEDNRVICDKVLEEENKTDENQDNEVISDEVAKEENRSEPEEAPEFEDNVMKFVEFCQKKAKNKEQLEYIKKMMAKVMSAADSDS